MIKNKIQSVGVKHLVFAFCLVLSVATTNATPQDEEFQKLAKDYIEAMLQTYPEYATELGDHRFDDRLTDYSAETRAKTLANNKAFLQKLEPLTDTTKLTGPNQIDVRILRENIRGRHLRSRGNERTGVESTHLQPEPGQQPLSPGRARFCSRRKANRQFAQTDGSDSESDRAGQKKSATFAESLH